MHQSTVKLIREQQELDRKIENLQLSLLAITEKRESLLVQEVAQLLPELSARTLARITTKYPQFLRSEKLKAQFRASSKKFWGLYTPTSHRTALPLFQAQFRTFLEELTVYKVQEQYVADSQNKLAKLQKERAALDVKLEALMSDEQAARKAAVRQAASSQATRLGARMPREAAYLAGAEDLGDEDCVANTLLQMATVYDSGASTEPDSPVEDICVEQPQVINGETVYPCNEVSHCVSDSLGCYS